MKSLTIEDLEALKNAAKSRFASTRDATLKSLHKKAETLRALAESASQALESELGKRGAPSTAASTSGAKTKSKAAPKAAKATKALSRKKTATGAAAKSVKAKVAPATQVKSRAPQQKNLRAAVKSQLAHSSARGRRNQARRDSKG